MFSSNTSPDTPFGNDGWEPGFTFDTKPMKQEGLGMNFFDQQADFNANPFDASNDVLDLIHLNGNDAIDFNSHPMSPDRRSVSSASSADQVSDFPDLDTCAMPTLNSDVTMQTVEEDDIVPDFGARTRQSRSNSRAPAPRAHSNHRYRRAPYSFSGHRRSSSVMSTASTMSMPVSLPATQCCSPLQEYQEELGFPNFSSGLDFGHDGTMMADDIFNTHMYFNNASFQEPLPAPKPMYTCDTMFLSSLEDPLFDIKAPIIPSSDIPNDHRHGSGGASCDDFADYAEEPDLFGPLSEEQSVPSEEDMNPEDKDLVPSEQDLRFEGDLYTPRFVRGQGNKREGYCGLCKPGRWLVLKNSAFWYDKSFTHGISAATGLPFDGPKETRRMSGNPDVWEGLCGSCDEWIALISNKKKGTTWFRHAYKCHSHNKNKDAPKKRRDSAASKSSKAVAKPKAIKQEETSQLESLAEDAQSEMQAPGKKVPALQTIGSFF
ncbi:MAG: hypothetical protein MMC23_008906 [Stictis urceolatum]|nr:hypothetical protein [Stictis urceolata]